MWSTKIFVFYAHLVCIGLILVIPVSNAVHQTEEWKLDLGHISDFQQEHYLLNSQHTKHHVRVCDITLFGDKKLNILAQFLLLYITFLSTFASIAIVHGKINLFLLTWPSCCICFYKRNPMGTTHYICYLLVVFDNDLKEEKSSTSIKIDLTLSFFQPNWQILAQHLVTHNDMFLPRPYGLKERYV